MGMNSDSFETFSGFGLKYLNQTAHLLAPEGNSLVREWPLMKWWHVLAMVIIYPFLLGNLRLYRFEQHQSPLLKYQPIALFFSVLWVTGYLFVLYQVLLYLFWDSWIDPLLENDPNLQDDLQNHSKERIAFILCFFHVLRFFFDVTNTLQSTLMRTVNELRSEQAINEIRFTLTHFLVWWLTILYYPGSEVLYTVAVVCLFYLGTILCTFSPGKYIRTKMMLWLILVSSNFLKLGSNLWMGSTFPASLLVVSPPYDINNNIHMTLFYFVRGFPLGAVFSYSLYGRGNPCSWWILIAFLFSAHWPIAHSSHAHPKDKLAGGNRPLSAAVKAIINTKQEEQMRKEIEKEKELEKQREKMKEKQKVSTQNHLKKSNGITGSKTKAIGGQNQPPHSKDQQNQSEENSLFKEKEEEGYNALYRKCSYYLCDHFESPSNTFQVCQRCRSPYCSNECQLKDWASNHKSYCKKFLLIKK